MDRYGVGASRLSAAWAILALLGGASTMAAEAVVATSAAEESVPVPAKEKKEELTEIVVTGSRIARTEDERLEPTQVITSEFMDRRAYTNVIDALSELPAFGEPD